jgi:uncharacterized protein
MMPLLEQACARLGIILSERYAGLYGPQVSEAVMDALTPPVDDISEEGLHLACAAGGEDLGLTEADAVIDGTLSVSLELRKHGDAVEVTGVLEGVILRECVRCLSQYGDPLSVAIKANYVRPTAQPSRPSKSTVGDKKDKPDKPNRSEVSADVPEDETYEYQGDQLMLAPMLREQAILAAPMQPLCREDCKGLCPHCGQDLNVRQCACPGEPHASPFSVLQGFKVTSSRKRGSE